MQDQRLFPDSLTHKLALIFSLLCPNRLFIPCICPLSLSLLSSPSFSPLSLSLSFTYSVSQAETSTHTDSFPPLSLQSLIKGITTVWFGGNSDAPAFCWVFPQTKLLKHNSVMLTWSECAFQGCLHHLNLGVLYLSHKATAKLHIYSTGLTVSSISQLICSWLYFPLSSTWGQNILILIL